MTRHDPGTPIHWETLRSRLRLGVSSSESTLELAQLRSCPGEQSYTVERLSEVAATHSVEAQRNRPLDKDGRSCLGANPFLHDLHGFPAPRGAQIFRGVTSCIILDMVTPGLHPAVPTLLAEASGNPPLMRQTCWPRSRGDTLGLSPAQQGNSSLPVAPCDPSSWTSVISTHNLATWLPLYRLFCRLRLLLALDAWQAVNRRSGAQLLEHGL